MLNSEITQAWENCLAAAQRYGSYIAALNQIDPDISYIEERIDRFNSSSGSSGSFGSHENFVIGETQTDSSFSDAQGIAGIVAQMKWNASQWHKTQDENQRAQLNARNLELGELLRTQYGVQAYRKPNGVWYVGDELLFEKYHDGGIVGGLDTQNNNELWTLLKKGELVLNDGQQRDFLDMVHELSGSIEQAMAANFGRALDQPLIIPESMQPGVTNFSPNIEVNISHNGAMTDADANQYGNTIADTALDKLWETMQKRGLTH